MLCGLSLAPRDALQQMKLLTLLGKRERCFGSWLGNLVMLKRSTSLSLVGHMVRLIYNDGVEA